MYEIPLFPLNTVLFPGTPLYLHIFEERYKRMISDCIQEHRPFGVALIKSGVEALGLLAEPHRVGCSAQIVQVQHLDGGRMNIVTVGLERFRIIAMEKRTSPYLMGSVVDYPLEFPDADSNLLKAEILRRQVERFLHILVRAGGDEIDLEQLPDDPVELAYSAAAVLQISPSQKQELLTLVRADDLVNKLHDVYRRELALLKAIVSGNVIEQEGPFSRN